MNLVDKVLGVQKILPETMVKNKADRAMHTESSPIKVEKRLFNDE